MQSDSEYKDELVQSRGSDAEADSGEASSCSNAEEEVDDRIGSRDGLFAHAVSTGSADEMADRLAVYGCCANTCLSGKTQ